MQFKHQKSINNYNRKQSNFLLPILLLLIFTIITNLNIIFTSINIFFQLLIFIIALNLFIIFFDLGFTNNNIYFSKENFLIFLLFSSYYLFGIFNNDNYRNSYGILLGLIQNLSIMIIINYTIREKQMLNKVLYVIEIAGVILSLLALLEFINYFHIMKIVNQYTFISGNRVGVTWINPNTFGMVLNFCYISSLYLPNDFKRMIFKLLLFLGILTTMSRSAVIVFIIINFVSLLLNKKTKPTFIKIVKYFLFFIIIFSLLAQILNNQTIVNSINQSRLSRVLIFSNFRSPDFTNSRLDALNDSFIILKNNIFTGIGFGNVSQYGVTNQSSHNMFIQIWAESGIIPFLLYVLFYFSIFIKLYSKRINHKYLVVLLYLFIFIFSYSFFTHNLITNPIFGICIGLLTLNYDRILLDFGFKEKINE